MSKITALSSIVGPVFSSGVLSSGFVSISPSVTSIYEGEGAVTFTVQTFAFANNTTAYYQINQTGGTVTGASFTSNSLTGSFVVNNNVGTFTLTSALESNTTDDYFTVSVSEASGGTARVTSSQIKIVDLTTYNTALAAYNTGFGGQTLSYTIGGSSTGAGNKTTVTFQGSTMTANGGAAGVLGGYAAGGTYSGTYDGGTNGGTGGLGASWTGVGGSGSSLTYAGGGGGPGGVSGGQPAGAWVGASPFYSSSGGVYTFLISNGYLASQFAGPATNVGGSGGTTQLQGSPGKYFGGGGGGGSFTKSLAANVTAYSITNGGAGQWGGGGGGGGASTKTNSLSQYTYATQAGGAGGAGVVILQYNEGTTGAVITAGTSRVIPTGVTSVKAWAVGGGGGGKASTKLTTAGVPSVTYGQNGGGGGGGAIVWRKWTFGSGAPTKPAL